jgi:hypothetical protein
MSKDFQAMKPREIEAYLREVILKTFGDKVENNSGVYAMNGFYRVYIATDKQNYQFINFRKGDAPKITKAIRALK